MSERFEQLPGETTDHPAYVRAFNAAATRATAAQIEMVVKKQKEFGRNGFNVYMACKGDADYLRYEIVRPGQPLMST